MTSTRFLSGVAAVALLMAAPSAGFAAWRGGGGGGAHIGGGAHFAGSTVTTSLEGWVAVW